jgi:hypothetical protein
MSSSTQLGEDDYENIRKIPDLYPIEYEPILDELKSACAARKRQCGENFITESVILKIKLTNCKLMYQN